MKDIQITIDTDDRQIATTLATNDHRRYGPDYADAMTVAAFLAGLEKHERDNVMHLAESVVDVRTS